MDEERKKALEITLQHRLKIFEEEWLPMITERTEEQRERLNLLNGIIIGLVYGVLGNLMVQYSFPVLDGVLSGKIDNIFWASVGIFASAIIVIVISTITFSRQRREAKRKYKTDHDRREYAKRVIEETIQRLEDLKRQ